MRTRDSEREKGEQCPLSFAVTQVSHLPGAYLLPVRRTGMCKRRLARISTKLEGRLLQVLPLAFHAGGAASG